MPNRILKESICTSENIDQLSSFQETVFYRLLVNCDDYGRMDARPKLLSAKLFPLKDIRAAQIEDALRALTSAELVILYEVDGKPFLQMKTWDRHQQVRAKKSKYPSPDGGIRTSDNICNQMISDDDKCPRNPIQSNPIYIDDNNDRVREGNYLNSEIGTLVSSCLKAMSPRAWDELRSYMEEMPNELIAWAVQTSCDYGGNNWAYVSKVLAGLSTAGIKTVEEAEKRREEHRRQKASRASSSGGNGSRNVVQTQYEQREYEERKEGELPAWLKDEIAQMEQEVSA